MQINLKQTEIIAALQGYISQQGINLAGKTVSVDFTAGRKETGISAEITIEDKQLISATEYLTRSYSGPVDTQPAATIAATVELEPTIDPEDAAKEAAAGTEEVKTTSLFG